MWPTAEETEEPSMTTMLMMMLRCFHSSLLTRTSPRLLYPYTSVSLSLSLSLSLCVCVCVYAIFLLAALPPTPNRDSSIDEVEAWLKIFVEQRRGLFYSQVERLATLAVSCSP